MIKHPLLLEKLGTHLHELPLNYFKAKAVFDSEFQPKNVPLLKFIPIDQLKTDFGLVKSYYRPIAKSLNLNADDEA
jgi:hypothetical protein